MQILIKLLFSSNSLYVATITLRVIAYYQTQKEIQFGTIMYDKREKWDDFGTADFLNL